MLARASIGFVNRTKYDGRGEGGPSRRAGAWRTLPNAVRAEGASINPFLYRCFPSIDHAVLKADMRRRVRCKRTLRLIDAGIDGSNPQEPVYLYYPGGDLLTLFERRRGCPSATSPARSSPTSISTAWATS